jgi:septal ring factor EnvC (AmiA/AmiB activator)
MPNTNTGPSISWQTIVGVMAVIGLLNGAQWAVSQVEFASVKETATTGRDDLIRAVSKLEADITALQAMQAAIAAKLAHDPVEDRTFQAVIAALGKQIDQIQAQIADINRQIAAALIIIDNNSGSPKRGQQALPP